MRGKKGTRLAIWALDSKLTIEEVLALLDKNYNINQDFLNDFDIPSEDKIINNKWTSSDPNKALQVEEKNIAGKKVKYISAIGQYETSYGEKRAIVAGRPLPRNSRVFNHAFNAIFFEHMERVYCAFEASSSQEGRIKSNLFGVRRRNSIEGWGKITTLDTPPYKFDSNFYYWIFSKKGRTFKFGSNDTVGELKLIDVSAVSQLSDREVYDSSTEGADVLASTSALSALGTNQSVYRGGFGLSYGDYTIYLNIHSNGSSFINEEASVFLVNDQAYQLAEVFEDVVLLIYSFILPELLASFGEEINNENWKTIHKSLRKKWALQAIRDLCEENDIHIEEIDDII